MSLRFRGYGGPLCSNGLGFISVVHATGGNVGAGKNFELPVVEVSTILIEGFTMLAGKVNLQPHKVYSLLEVGVLTQSLSQPVTCGGFFNMEQVVPPLMNSKPCNKCRINAELHESSDQCVLQVPLLLEGHLELHDEWQAQKLSTMGESYRIGGASYDRVLRMVVSCSSSMFFHRLWFCRWFVIWVWFFWCVANGDWQAGAELIAVFLVMFSSCGTAIANKKANGNLNLLGFATAGGLSVMMMVFAVGNISGAHLNPAVTLAFASKKMFPLQLVSEVVFSPHNLTHKFHFQANRWNLLN